MDIQTTSKGAKPNDCTETIIQETKVLRDAVGVFMEKNWKSSFYNVGYHYNAKLFVYVEVPRDYEAQCKSLIEAEFPNPVVPIVIRRRW